MFAQVKANTTDRYLKPIRQQIVELINPESKLLEFGCGTGDLLFQLAAKIKKGIGIDNNKVLINFAFEYAKTKDFKHLEFEQADALEYQTAERVDYTIASLVFHVLPLQDSKNLLHKMMSCSNTAIICGFAAPKTWMQRFMLFIDQRFTAHYKHYKAYAQHGYMTGLLADADVKNFQVIDTFDPVIKIYKISP